MTPNIAWAASSIRPRSALAAFAHPHQGEAEENGEEQDLEDIADLEHRRRARLAQSGVGRDEGADDAVGNDMQEISTGDIFCAASR